ncbi:MAG: hypothetical protein K0R38_4409 [Polyangiaceae bacterium]|nr:hypothetical protein [Polyangiaceae bacterium]
MFPVPTLRLATSVVAFALVLAACGGNDPRFAPLDDAEAPPAPDAEQTDASSAARRRPARTSEGALEVTVTSAVTSYLSRVHGVVTDADGTVVAGAEAEAITVSAEAAERADAAPELRLVLPEGEDYTLTLTASTTDAEPTGCRAVVGPLRVTANAVASVRVLAWDCGGPIGYVPSAAATNCFWLAEWLYVSRTSAAVGEDVEVSAAGHDASGNLARFEWSVPPPALGYFAAPQAPRTTFRCRRPGAPQLMAVTISDGECQAELSQYVACQ